MDAVKFEVPPELFVTTESSSFAGQLALGTLEAGPDTYTFSQPVDWNVDRHQHRRRASGHGQRPRHGNGRVRPLPG